MRICKATTSCSGHALTTMSMQAPEKILNSHKCNSLHFCDRFCQFGTYDNFPRRLLHLIFGDSQVSLSNIKSDIFIISLLPTFPFGSILNILGTLSCSMLVSSLVVWLKIKSSVSANMKSFSTMAARYLFSC